VAGAAIAVAIALVFVSAARAATFSVDPIIISLPKGNSSTSVAITNQSTEKLRLQVTGFAWEQSPSGEMKLTPTDDLVFFPQLLQLDPGETRRVRIGVTADQGAVEKTFRVFMEELPSLQSVVAPKQTSVTIRMKVGVPVFVSAAGNPVVTGTVRNATVRDNVLSFDVVNTGNTHFSIQQVRVVAKNSAGTDLFSRELTGWYLLAGGARHFSVPISKEGCNALHSLAVQVRTESITFSNSFDDVSKQCGTAGRP
jgi:fimbrial chaperone protein